MATAYDPMEQIAKARLHLDAKYPDDPATQWAPSDDVRKAKKSVAASLAAAKSVEAIDKQCFFNARDYVCKVDKAAIYVEGYAFSDMPLPAIHAWVVSGRKLIDPTPSWTKHSNALYIPMIAFVGADAVRAFMKEHPKTKKLALHCAFGDYFGERSKLCREAKFHADELSIRAISR